MLKKIFKKLLKKITQSQFISYLICLLLTLIIKIIYKTCRFQYHNLEKVKPFWQENKPIIAACWHGRIMLAPFAWQGKKTLNALVSPHRDGLIMSGVLKRLGIKIISGSSFKKPSQAALRIKKTLANQESVVIVPDGPRGPRMKLGISIIYFAKISGCPIIPLSFSAKPCKIMNSWDQFMLVYPFAEGVYLYGEPVYVSENCDPETMEILRSKLEEQMIIMQNKADNLIKEQEC